MTRARVRILGVSMIAAAAIAATACGLSEQEKALMKKQDEAHAYAAEQLPKLRQKQLSGKEAATVHATILDMLTNAQLSTDKIGTSTVELAQLECNAYGADAMQALQDLRNSKADVTHAGQLKQKFLDTQAKSCEPIGKFGTSIKGLDEQVARNRLEDCRDHRGGCTVTAAMYRDAGQEVPHVLRARAVTKRAPAKPTTKKSRRRTTKVLLHDGGA